MKMNWPMTRTASVTTMMTGSIMGPHESAAPKAPESHGISGFLAQRPALNDTSGAGGDEVGSGITIPFGPVDVTAEAIACSTPSFVADLSSSVTTVNGFS